MPNPNAIVSRSIRLEAPPERAVAEFLRAEGGLSVELDDGRRVRLDPENPRSPGFAQVLEGLAQLGRPVYVEVDPETSAIGRLFIPHVAHVIGLRPTEAGYDVSLDMSHARHGLRRDRPDFAELEGRLREALDKGAPVIVTDDDAQDIIDVRFFDYGPEAGPILSDLPIRPIPASPLRGLFAAIWYCRLWPWWWGVCISSARAQQIFDAMSATSCNPLTVPPPCIPFLYPDDGCWGRAHEMCRLIINMGVAPRKVWIQGSLHTLTRNNPNCFVNWAWHVAPTVCVRWHWWLLWSRRMVIDPSLFTTPVTEATWKSVQGDPNATLTQTDWTDFLWGSTDPNFVQTNQVLATYRLQLQNRSNQVGPPPYANCP
jgi:Glutaminase